MTDVAAALGRSSHGSAGRNLRGGILDDHETRHILRSTVETSAISFPFRGALAVSESGLYKYLLRAQRSNPRAKAFQDWVTLTVLPAIRKDGMYVQGEEKVATGELSEDEFILKAMKMMEAKVTRLTSERDAAVAAKKDEIAGTTYCADQDFTATTYIKFPHSSAPGFTYSYSRGRSSRENCGEL